MHLIPSVLPSHSGTYSCVAENVLGQVTNQQTDDDDGKIMKSRRTDSVTIDEE